MCAVASASAAWRLPGRLGAKGSRGEPRGAELRLVLLGLPQSSKRTSPFGLVDQRTPMALPQSAFFVFPESIAKGSSGKIARLITQLNLHEPTCSSLIAQPNLHEPTCTSQLARANLHEPTYTSRLARANLHEPTCTSQLARANLHEPTCTSQLARAN